VGLISTTPATSRSSARFSAFSPSPIPRAREDSFRVVFYASKIFGRKTAQLSETPRESVYSGSASENRLRNTRFKKRFFTRHLLASFMLRVSCFMALFPVDREVLNTAFGMSSAANEPLNPDAVRSKLGGINEEDFYVSLEIMEVDGLIETSRKLARRPSNFWVTFRGVVKLLDENGQRPAIQAAVEKAIVAKPNSTLSEIAGAVAQPPLIVAAIVETLEDWGEIDVQRGLGVELQVSGVHAALRRRVQEAGQ
jgi:hypothetical protein